MIVGRKIRGVKLTGQRPVRLAYQPPGSSTFLSEQTSHQPGFTEPVGTGPETVGTGPTGPERSGSDRFPTGPNSKI
jgi:hypothetical protein